MPLNMRLVDIGHGIASATIGAVEREKFGHRELLVEKWNLGIIALCLSVERDRLDALIDDVSG